MVEFDHLPLNQVIESHPDSDIIRNILASQPVAKLLSRGCYIAGGFGRALLSKMRMEEYLGIELKTGVPPGDVDIFFENQDLSSELASIFMSSNRSWGRNALQKSVFIRGTPTSFRAQLVDHQNLILPLEEQLNRFDFLNAAVAITGDRVVFPKRFWELESSRLLHIQRSTSPFLGSRIIKYFNHRGMRGITPESEAAVTDWIIRAMCKDFKLEADGKIMEESIMSNVKAILSNKDITRADDLLLVLGKFRSNVSEGPYGPVKQVDFALTKLAERGHNVRVPQ